MQAEGLAGGQGGELQRWDEGSAEGGSSPAALGAGGAQLPITTSLKKQHSQNGVNCRRRKAGINGNWF